MTKEYMLFCITYDFAAEFEKYDLTCDRAYEVAKEIIREYTSEYDEESRRYETLSEFYKNVNVKQLVIRTKNYCFSENIDIL